MVSRCVAFVQVEIGIWRGKMLHSGRGEVSTRHPVRLGQAKRVTTNNLYYVVEVLHPEKNSPGA
jgi:hypothetical protein